MVELKTEYPFKDINGEFDYGRIKHWAEDENGKQYLIRQLESDDVYGEAVDVYPCPFQYEIVEDENITEE